jgi:acetoin utilization deacetylase AcuC-like enzyme
VGEARYLETLDRALGMVAGEAFGAVAVSAGFDTYAGDLASLGLKERSYMEIGRRIAGLGKPTFFVLEGGYMGEKVGKGIDSLLRGFEG